MATQQAILTGSDGVSFKCDLRTLQVATYFRHSEGFLEGSDRRYNFAEFTGSQLRRFVLYLAHDALGNATEATRWAASNSLISIIDYFGAPMKKFALKLKDLGKLTPRNLMIAANTARFNEKAIRVLLQEMTNGRPVGWWEDDSFCEWVVPLFTRILPMRASTDAIHSMNVYRWTKRTESEQSTEIRISKDDIEAFRQTVLSRKMANPTRLQFGDLERPTGSKNLDALVDLLTKVK